MSVKYLFIIRGLPGVGKTTLGEMLADVTISTDDFFMDGGRYRFDPSKLVEAHEDCLNRVRREMADGTGKIAVANTFIKYGHYKPYVAAARHYGYRYVIIDLYNQALSDAELADRNEHNVPVQTITAMRYAYQCGKQNAGIGDKIKREE